MRPTLLAVALLAAGLHAQDALALGLGAIRTKSVIGEPFRAEITLLGEGDSVPTSNCFALDAPTTAVADDLPWLTGARIRTQGRTVFISSRQAINDPILMVGVKISCGFELAREYAVLMQPSGTLPAEEPAAPTVAVHSPPVSAMPFSAEPVAAAPAARIASEAPARRKAPEGQKTRRTKVNEGADRLFVAPNLDSASSLKMSGGLSRRAEASEAQREVLRTEQRLLAALDEQIATHLAIADKVRQLEARMAVLQKQLGRTEASMDAALGSAPAAPLSPQPEPAIPVTPPAATDAATEASVPDEPGATDTTEVPVSEETVAPPPAGLTNEPVRVINKLPPEAAATSETPGAAGVNWLVAALGVLAAGSVLGGTWVWRRRARKLTASAALRSRHAEEAITRMMMSQTAPQSRIETLDAQDVPADDGPEAPPPAYPVAADEVQRSTTSIEHFPGEAPPDHIDEVAITPPGLTKLATGNASAVHFELGNHQEELARPAKLDLEFDSFVGSASSLGAPDAGKTPSGPRLVSSMAAAPAALSFDQSARPANEEAAPSHEHVLELAEIMMSFGRAEGAAQALAEFLRDYPKESIIPWLKLLDLYHSSGQRGEYDDLAPKLNRAFNAKVPDWENFDGPTASESVEQFGHIMARIHATWPNQDCLDYLVELLRDNRAGVRAGFPLGVIDDILLLKAVLEWLIANPSITETQPTRLALI